MKFTYDNREYDIEFSYSTKGRNKKRRRRTTATITTTDDGRIVADARVQCNPEFDVFNYADGRKEALRSALVCCQSEFRTAVWTAYHSRPGGILGQPAEPITDEMRAIKGIARAIAKAYGHPKKGSIPDVSMDSAVSEAAAKLSGQRPDTESELFAGVEPTVEPVVPFSDEDLPSWSLPPVGRTDTRPSTRWEQSVTAT